ncbi:DUF3301 domain-containing protein [Psychromonas sp. MME2]|uniref:DUF3301 domain-containing protein n=1 Tax=unclassified Psychromonas TaxID=2614957 RepID=UPI00339C9621
MTDLLFIVLTIIIAILIWKLRQQSEYAKELITQHCYKLDLQLLSVARSGFNFKLGEQFLQASFVFEFSSDNDNNYQGVLFLTGLRTARFKLPVYRTYEDPNTLH